MPPRKSPRKKPTKRELPPAAAAASEADSSVEPAAADGPADAKRSKVAAGEHQAQQLEPPPAPSESAAAAEGGRRTMARPGRGLRRANTMHVYDNHPETALSFQEVKKALKARGLSTAGKKVQLEARLAEAMVAEGIGGDEEEEVDDDEDAEGEDQEEEAEEQDGGDEGAAAKTKAPKRKAAKEAVEGGETPSKPKKEKKAKAPKKETVPKAPKPVPGVPTKPELEELVADPFFDRGGDELLDAECKTYAVREPIRAALSGNVELLKALIADKVHVPAFDAPRDPVDDRAALHFAILRNDVEAATLLHTAAARGAHGRVAPRVSRLGGQGTGEYNFETLGHAVGKIGAGRGGKELNNALLDGSAASQLDASDVAFGSAAVTRETLLVLQQLGVISEDKGVLPALQSGNIEGLRFCLQILSKRGGFGIDALHIAAAGGGELPAKIVEKSVTKQNHVQRVNQTTPLHMACINPDPTTLARLLTIAPAAASKEDSFQRQPLHYAAVASAPAPLRLLLEKGADRRVMDKNKQTPLMLACAASRPENVAALLDIKAAREEVKVYDFGKQLKSMVALLDSPVKLSADAVAVLNGLLSELSERVLESEGALESASRMRAALAAVLPEESEQDELTGEATASADQALSGAQSLGDADAQLLLEKVNERSEDALLQMFKRIDADASGEIDISEIKAVFDAIKVELTADELKLDVMAEMDTDQNGTVSFAEFADWMKSGSDLAKKLRRSMQKRAGLTRTETEEAEEAEESNKEAEKNAPPLLDMKLPLEGQTVDAEAAALLEGCMGAIARSLLEKSCAAAGTQGKSSVAVAHVLGAVGNDPALKRTFSAASSVTMNWSFLDSKDTEGYTALHHAAASGSVDCLRMLVACKPKLLNLAGPERKTALHLASERGHIECARLLLSKGAKVDSKDKRGKTPLLGAVRAGRAREASMLLRFGANPDSADSSGNTVCLNAAAFGWRSCVDLLVAAKADFSTPNSMQLSPLYAAFQKGHTKIAEHMLSVADIDINLRASSGSTLLLDSMARLSWPDVKQQAALIENYGADTTICSLEGSTPLHIVCAAPMASEADVYTSHEAEQIRLQDFSEQVWAARKPESLLTLSVELSIEDTPQKLEHLDIAYKDRAPESSLTLCVRRVANKIVEELKTYVRSAAPAAERPWSFVNLTETVDMDAASTWVKELDQPQSLKDALNAVVAPHPTFSAAMDAVGSAIETIGSEQELSSEQQQSLRSAIDEAKDGIARAPVRFKVRFTVTVGGGEDQVKPFGAAEMSHLFAPATVVASSVLNKESRLMTPDVLWSTTCRSLQLLLGSTEEQTAIEMLGWDFDAWIEGQHPLLEWRELSKAQQAAAVLLGLTEETWRTIPATLMTNIVSKAEATTAEARVVRVNLMSGMVELALKPTDVTEEEAVKLLDEWILQMDPRMAGKCVAWFKKQEVPHYHWQNIVESFRHSSYQRQNFFKGVDGNLAAKDTPVAGLIVNLDMQRCRLPASRIVSHHISTVFVPGDMCRALFAEKVHIAVESAKLLVTHKADIDALDKPESGSSALQLAIKAGKIDLSIYLMESGAKCDHPRTGVEACSPPLIQILNMSARDWKKAGQSTVDELFRCAIEHGADVNQATSDSDPRPPLLVAIEKGKLDEAKALIDTGAVDLSKQTADGRTALIVAIQKGFLELAKLLIDQGADLSITTTEGKTALFVAVECNHLKLADMLLDLGATASCNINGSNVFHLLFSKIFEGNQEQVLGSFGTAAANPATANFDFSRKLLSKVQAWTTELLNFGGTEIVVPHEQFEIQTTFSAKTASAPWWEKQFRYEAPASQHLIFKLNKPGIRCLVSKVDIHIANFSASSNPALSVDLYTGDGKLLGKTKLGKSGMHQIAIVEAVQCTSIKLVFHPSSTDRVGYSGTNMLINDVKVHSTMVEVSPLVNLIQGFVKWLPEAYVASKPFVALPFNRLLELLGSLPAGCDVGSVRLEGQTLLHLLASGAPVDTWAGWAGSASRIEDIVDLLIKRGIDINAQSGNGQTASMVMVAASRRTDAVPMEKNPLTKILLLRSQGAGGLDISDTNGDTVCTLLSHELPISSVLLSNLEFLKSLGIDLNQAQRRTGRTVVHAVATARRVDTFEKLLALGVQPVVDQPDKHEQTPLHLAVIGAQTGTNANFEMEEALIEAGADVDSKDKAGRTILHYSFLKPPSTLFCDAFLPELLVWWRAIRVLKPVPVWTSSDCDERVLPPSSGQPIVQQPALVYVHQEKAHEQGKRICIGSKRWLYLGVEDFELEPAEDIRAWSPAAWVALGNGVRLDPVETVTCICSSTQADINVADHEGMMPLHVAALCGASISSLKLMGKGASLTAEFEGNTPLALSFEQWPDLSILLMRDGATVPGCCMDVVQKTLSMCKEPGKVPGKAPKVGIFLKALEYVKAGRDGYLGAIYIMLDSGLSKRVALTEALQALQFNMVVVLLSKATEMELREVDIAGKTLLHSLAELSTIDDALAIKIAGKLLRKGVGYFKDKAGMTPLCYCRQRGHRGLGRYLLEGGSIGQLEEVFNEEGHGLVAQLCFQSIETPADPWVSKLVGTFMERGLSCAADRSGVTPLMHAAANQHLEVCRLLLNRCGHIDIVAENTGFANLHYAIGSVCNEPACAIAELFLTAGASTSGSYLSDDAVYAADRALSRKPKFETTLLIHSMRKAVVPTGKSAFGLVLGACKSNDLMTTDEFGRTALITAAAIGSKFSLCYARSLYVKVYSADDAAADELWHQLLHSVDRDGKTAMMHLVGSEGSSLPFLRFLLATEKKGVAS
jgi:ankyrin repeat protein